MELIKDLPKNLCPLIKSSYGFGKTDKCPFFYFSDLVVGETTCDGKKKMYEYIAEFKDVHVMELPNRQTADGLQLWKNEIIRFKEALEEKFNVTITEDQIREAIKVNALVDKIHKEYSEGKMLEKKPRILVTGCPMGGATEKVIKAIEDNDGVVVTYESCSGAKSIDKLVDENDPDVYHALAERYLSIGCSVMTPNPNRLKLLGRLIDEYKVDGVVEMILQACHIYNVETLGIRKFVNEEKHIPYINVETDFSQSDVGQLSTRLTASIEML